MDLVFQFPGQSSRYPGMVPRIASLRPENGDILAEASAALDRDLAHHYRADNADAYACNRDIQIGVFLANHMFLATVEAAGVTANASFGLSLGEWNHLVHIGALSFRDALVAVERRGEAYDGGPRGAMASVFPIDVGDLEDVIARTAGDDLLEIVCHNSPRQLVIAGDSAAIARAIEVLENELFVQAVVIEKNIPMHSSRFAPVAARFRETLEQLPFAYPERPYFPNCLGQALCAPTRAQFVDMLSNHVCQPVLWRQSVDRVIAARHDAVFLEVGPKSVLHNLLDRRWHRSAQRYHTDSCDDLEGHLDEVLTALREHRQRGAVA